MSEIQMRPLEGTNPLGVLAALGTFRSAAIEWPDVRLRWECSDIVPYPALVFDSEVSIEDLLDVLDRQRAAWRASALLNNEHADVKAVPLGEWATAISKDRSGMPVDELFVALVSEGAGVLKQEKKVPGQNGPPGKTKVNKPSHLHFTAGQQQFLDIVREVLDASVCARLREAILGPWRFDATTKTLRWDPRGERIYAVRGFNPSKDPSLNVPGADWLAFVGRCFFPTVNRNGTLETTACNRDWKVSAMRWPLWDAPLALSEVRQLFLSDILAEGARLRPERLIDVGVSAIVEAPIRRMETGGWVTSVRPRSFALQSDCSTLRL